MDFSLSEQQSFLQSTVKDFLDADAPLSRVRELAADGTTLDSNISDGLTGLGVPGVLIPEEYGGVGLTCLDAALVAECLGGAVTPYSFIGPCAMVVQALLCSPDEDLKNTWLPKIANGEESVAVAVADHTGKRDSHGITCDDARLNGQTMFALDVEGAGHVLVADTSKQLFLANLDDVEVIPLKSIDRTRSLAELKFDNVSATNLATSPNDLSKVIALGRVLLAADTLGAGQTMLNKAVEYAGERKQFNRVIGSFQAVKHLCAEMAADLEPCRSMVWYAAHSIHAIPEEAILMTNHAKAHLGETGRTIARKATEVHGGMGFTDLLGLHFWFKRIELNRQLLGTPSHIRAEIAHQQEWVTK